MQHANDPFDDVFDSFDDDFAGFESELHGTDGPSVLMSPNPGPQELLVTCPVSEIFYGGARGGGKTAGLGLHWLIHSAPFGHDYKGIIFRRTYDELDEVISQFKAMFLPLGAQWLAGARTFIMPNGATLKCRYLDRDDDATHYQGHQYTWIAFDEAGNWPNMSCINVLRACLRSTVIPNEERFFILTGNPGGVGHNWLKSRYVDPAPPFTIIRSEEQLPGADGKPTTIVNERVFIPSLLRDNPALVENDPEYINRLYLSGPEWLVKAWIEGDWNIVAGGMFDDVWRQDKNVLPPTVIPSSWRVDRSFDWGSAKPFSVGWWAESDGTPLVYPDGRQIHVPRGSIIRVHEWYGSTGEADVGLKMLARDVARGILDIEKELRKSVLRNVKKVHPGPADTAIYTAENGVCIADDMAAEGVTWTHADKSPGSRKSGWERMRRLLKEASASPRPEEPVMLVFDTCRDFIRTIPVLPRNKRDIDDLDTKSEDHIADESRYRAMQVLKQIKVTKLKGL